MSEIRPEPENDGEEPDLYDAVIEYRNNHPPQQLTREQAKQNITQAVQNLTTEMHKAAQIGIEAEITFSTIFTHGKYFTAPASGKIIFREVNEDP